MLAILRHEAPKLWEVPKVSLLKSYRFYLLNIRFDDVRGSSTHIVHIPLLSLPVLLRIISDLGVASSFP